MIVIDTSAVMAILLREPEAGIFSVAISANSVCAMSACTFLEWNIVVDRLKPSISRPTVAEFVRDLEIEIRTFDEAQARIAADAYRRFGRGNHRAGLNFGDCFAYALAKSLDAPLLFKGADFAHTDVRPWRA